MTASSKQLLDQVLALDEFERVEFIDRLSQSVGAEKEEGYDQAWEVEIKQRLSDIDAGKVGEISAEESVRRLRIRAGRD